MTVLFIVIAIVIFMVYMFRSDKSEAIEKNIQRGGLTKRFPNFVNFCINTSTFPEAPLELVKDDGEFLEYKAKMGVGYFYLGLQNNFGTYLYVYATSAKGRKIKGPLQQLHNGNDISMPEDADDFQYHFIFTSLIDTMENQKDFAKDFFEER